MESFIDDIKRDFSISICNWICEFVVLVERNK